MIARRLAVTAASVALALGMAGCSESSLDAEASARLQASVVAVAESASAGDDATALQRLDELQAELDSAVGADLITAARASRVQSAIDAVRADLESIAADRSETPEPAPVETTTGQDSSSGQDSGTSNDNRGPGKNNGKGKDKDPKGG